jgi:hypothetical protein
VNFASPIPRAKTIQPVGAAIHGPPDRGAQRRPPNAVRVFHSRQLGEEKETIEQTRVGAIDLNRTNVAGRNLVPAMNVLAMLFLFRSIDHLQKVLDGPIGSEILGSFEAYGFVGLAFYDPSAIDLQQRQADLAPSPTPRACGRAAIRIGWPT